MPTQPNDPADQLVVSQLLKHRVVGGRQCSTGNHAGHTLDRSRRVAGSFASVSISFTSRRSRQVRGQTTGNQSVRILSPCLRSISG